MMLCMMLCGMSGVQQANMVELHDHRVAVTIITRYNYIPNKANQGTESLQLGTISCDDTISCPSCLIWGGGCFVPKGIDKGLDSGRGWARCRSKSLSPSFTIIPCVAWALVFWAPRFVYTVTSSVSFYCTVLATTTGEVVVVVA